MKGKVLFFFLPLVVILTSLYVYKMQDNPKDDIAPIYNDVVPSTGNELDTVTPANFPYPRVWSFNHSAIPGVNAGTVGAIYFQGKYIMNRWNSNTLYRFNPDGPNGGPGTISDSNTAYAGQIRDLTIAPDGSGTEYLWGGRATTGLYKMTANGTQVATYTHTGAAYRTIAWDPNRKGFWSSNFADNIVCRDTTGAVKGTITGTAMTGKYGMAFDSISTQDSAFLWVWSQDFSNTADTTNKLYKIHVMSGQIKATYDFNVGPHIAGGAEIIVKDNQVLLLLNFQNFAVAAYRLRQLTQVQTSCANFMGAPQTSGVTGTLYSASAVNELVGWVGGTGAAVRRTTDGGTTWTNAMGGGVTGDVYNVHALNRDTAFCTTTPSTTTFIYKTTNGGSTWTQVYSQAGGFINAIHMVSATTGYAQGDPVGGKWTVLMTTDGGSTWTRMATEPTPGSGEAGWNN